MGQVAERQPESNLFDDPIVCRRVGKGHGAIGIARNFYDGGPNAWVCQLIIMSAQLSSAQQTPGEIQICLAQCDQAVPDPVIEHTDAGVEGQHVAQAFLFGDVFEQSFVNVLWIVAVRAAERSGLFACIQIAGCRSFEEKIDIVEEKRVAIEIEKLSHAAQRQVRQHEKFVEGRVKSQDGTAGMGTLQEFLIIPQKLYVNVLPFGLVEEFIAGGIKEKQPHGNRLVVDTQAADALNPLLLATPIGRIGQRVIDDSHALPAMTHWAGSEIFTAKICRTQEYNAALHGLEGAVKFTLSVISVVVLFVLLSMAQSSRPVPPGMRHAQELEAENESGFPPMGQSRFRGHGSATPGSGSIGQHGGIAAVKHGQGEPGRVGQGSDSEA